MNELFLACICAFVFFGIFTLLLRYFIDPPSTVPLAATDGGESSRRSVSVKGLHREEINTLPVLSYLAFKDLEIGKGSKAECPVCLAEFDDDDSIRLLPICDHAFHSKCIENWLIGTGTCPVCRTDLTAESSRRRADQLIEV